MANSPAQPSPSVDATLARHGGLSYLEIPAADPKASATFYQRVLGWNIQGEPTGAPKFSDREGLLIGRWITGRPVSREPGMLAYFYVRDIREAVAQAAANGGEVEKWPYPEGNLLAARVFDPAGNVIGLWQANA